jgi:hypothetical protein
MHRYKRRSAGRCWALLGADYSAQIRAGMRCPDPALPGKGGLCWIHPFKDPELSVTGKP